MTVERAAPSSHLPAGYSLRTMCDGDHADVAAICRLVYPSEPPYTHDELVAHQRVFSTGQFVVTHDQSSAVVSAHLTLIVCMTKFHFDDSWDTMTARGTFADHDPRTGHTLYGADLIVHPAHQHHGIGRALTLAARALVEALRLWRMVGGSRMPGYGQYRNQLTPATYIEAVKKDVLIDPALTAHLHDGWNVLGPVRGYLPHDEESAGWAAVIDWINPECPPPPGQEIESLPRRQP